jgi:lipid-binding SYLF domain-containing protein
MKKLICAMFIGVLFSTVLSSDKQTRLIESSSDVIAEMASTRDKGVPGYLLRDAQAIAVFPGVTKAGLALGGQFGKGILVQKLNNGEWSNPVFLDLYSGSIGWQIGVASTDLVLVFRTAESVKEMINKKQLTLGPDASVAAGPYGRQAGAATSPQLKAQILSYSKAEGAFVGLSFSGTIVRIDRKAIDSFYKKHMGVEDLLSNQQSDTPSSVLDFKDILTKHTANQLSSK